MAIAKPDVPVLDPQVFLNAIIGAAADRSPNPDVISAPAPGIPWVDTSGLVTCPDKGCTGPAFDVTGYLILNGAKHRMFATCLTCDGSGIWEWPSESWITWTAPDEETPEEDDPLPELVPGTIEVVE